MKVLKSDLIIVIEIDVDEFKLCCGGNEDLIWICIFWNGCFKYIKIIYISCFIL